jgi:hypothetical protein
MFRLITQLFSETTAISFALPSASATRSVVLLAAMNPGRRGHELDVPEQRRFCVAGFQPRGEVNIEAEKIYLCIKTVLMKSTVE